MAKQLVGACVKNIDVLDIDTEEFLFRLSKYKSDEPNVFGWVVEDIKGKELLRKFYMDWVSIDKIKYYIKKELKLI